MVKIYWFHGGSSQRLCGSSLLEFRPALPSGPWGAPDKPHLDSWWPSAWVGGTWLSSLRPQTLGFFSRVGLRMPWWLIRCASCMISGGRRKSLWPVVLWERQREVGPLVSANVDRDLWAGQTWPLSSEWCWLKDWKLEHTWVSSWAYLLLG